VDLSALQPKGDGMTLKSAYTEDDMTEITVTVGEKVSKELHLPGFGAIAAVVAIATLAALTYTTSARRNNLRLIHISFFFSSENSSKTISIAFVITLGQTS